MNDNFWPTGGAVSKSFEYLQGMLLMAHTEFCNVRSMHLLSIAFKSQNCIEFYETKYSPQGH